MRIGVFLPSLRGGGAEKVFLRLANGFCGQGHDVDLVLANCEGPYVDNVSAEVNVIDLQSKRTLTSLPGLLRYLRRIKPDVLLSAMDHANIVAIAARFVARSNCRLVISIRSTMSVRDKYAVGRERLIPFIARSCYRYADEIVAVSRGVADDLCLSTAIPRDKIHVIYNPIDVENLARRSGEPNSHPWFKPDRPPVLVSVGRFTAAKDYPTLIRAFSLVSAKRQTRLIILGDGNDRPKIEELVRKLGLENAVCLPGFVENPYSYMSKSALYVLSSAWEGLPNAMMEAMACGIPVVSTDCRSGPAEILENGKLGKLVPVGDVKKLSEAILTALDEKPNPESLRSRIREFAFDDIVDEYIGVLSGNR